MSHGRLARRRELAPRRVDQPHCSKCRSALSILDAERAHYTVRYYLQQPPTVGELREVLHRLNLDPWQITPAR